MKSFLIKKKLHLLLFLTIATLGGFYLYSAREQSNVSIQSYPWVSQNLTNKDDLTRKATGRLHLTLEKIGGDLPQQLYFFNLESKKLEMFSGRKQSPNITSKLSPIDKRVLAFVSWNDNNLSQIFTIDNSSTLQEITKSNTLKLAPEWSSDGVRIAYSALELEKAQNFDSLKPEDWSVYVTDLNGNEVFIGSGIYPKWLPDDQGLLVMKNDGLYIYDSKKRGGDGRLVWRVVGGEASISSMRLDVSSDGKKLAWSNIEKGEIVLIDVNSWETLDLTIYKRLPSTSFWPVFSPDGHFLVVQEIDYNADKPNPRLVIYNLKTFARETVLDLSKFNQEKMFVSDWSE